MTSGLLDEAKSGKPFCFEVHLAREEKLKALVFADIRRMEVR
jgi:hypothetical protein